MLKRVVALSLLILLPVVSFNAKGKPISKKELREYFADEKVVELILAANKGDIKKIDSLVSQGADVNYIGKDNVTPLIAAFSSLNIKGFKRLLEHGANPNIATSEGESVIWFAAMGGEISKETLPFLELCLQHGGDPNWVFRKRYEDGVNHFDDGRPLIAAVIMYNERAMEALKLLLNSGADINMKDKDGNNALWHAAGGHYEILLYLLQAGADYAANNNYGRSFIWDLEKSPTISFGDEKDMAQQKEWKKKVIAFLKEKGIEVHLKYPD
ncbi:MAG TPA: ankyrin repeat domain-containing protein [Acidobacteriota bacterium]|nr:ankyrin repeat domain-containing protein [Acidobacteriota bacterium]HNT16802.1 ankyrin repeat domain-containing protein [Acidobacteriota bacterium]HPA27730.1 ankyrin repeat domain-containing protein [Acidobacteriota bacterium]HQO19345.1 ankyrin repeat domain-containing protein [Acidobacteriota bacterium]HQQ46474.1 ankyrin repeat domain-containing protein [Acidobacteriota bacterium]